MKPILISSCHVCDQDKWKALIGNSKGDYKCEKCGRVINKILRRKEDEPRKIN